MMLSLGKRKFLFQITESVGSATPFSGVIVTEFLSVKQPARLTEHAITRTSYEQKSRDTD